MSPRDRLIRYTMNMHKILILTVFVIGLYGCAPGYVWVNTGYPMEEREDRLVLDKGVCMAEAEQSYPDPYPVYDPADAYDECMFNTYWRDTYPVRTEDGRIIYRTISGWGNRYWCMPSWHERHAYRDYERELQRQRASRSQYLNSCLKMKGWEQIPLE